MEETINLKELYQTLKKRFALIVTIALVATGVSGIVSYFALTPMYQTSTQLIVNSSSKDNSVDPSEIQGSIQLINTYNIIMKSPAILGKVIEQLDLDKTIDQLQSQMTVSNETNSQVIVLTVEDKNQNLARDIANTTATIFQKEIGNIMNVDNVSILAKAEVTEGMNPVSPRPMLNMAIALVVGIMMGIGLAFLLEHLDNTVKTEQDIEILLGLPVLGVIPMMSSNDMRGTRNKMAKLTTYERRNRKVSL